MDEAEPRSRERLDPLRRTETSGSGRGWRPGRALPRAGHQSVLVGGSRGRFLPLATKKITNTEMDRVERWEEQSLRRGIGESD